MNGIVFSCQVQGGGGLRRTELGAGLPEQAGRGPFVGEGFGTAHQRGE